MNNTHDNTNHRMADSNLRTVMEKEGYIRQRTAGGVVILRLLDPRPETIDAWYEDCNNLMAHWRDDQPLRYLHDIRKAEHVTPHATERVVSVLRRMRHIAVKDGRGAILLNNATIASLLSTFLKRRPQANWQIRFFSDEAQALAWLAE
jgi:hypothetical protein